MQNNRIKIYIDSFTNEFEYQGPITTQQIKEISIQEQENYEDFIFFTDGGDTFLYSNNDLVRVDKLYGLSLFQARKFIKQVSTWESKLEQLENMKKKLSQFELDDQTKANKVCSLENELQKLQAQQQRSQGSSQLEITQHHAKKIDELNRDKNDLDNKYYQLQLNFNDLQTQNQQLVKDKNSNIENYEKKIAQLNNEMKQYQREIQNQNINTKNDTSNLQSSNLQLQSQLDQIRAKNQTLELRIEAFDKDYELINQENCTLKLQLNYQQSRIQSINQNDQKQSLQEINYLQQLQEKQKEIDNLKLQHNEEIQSLNKKIMSFQTKNTDPRQSQIEIIVQKDKIITHQNDQIKGLEKQLMEAIQTYSDLENQFQQYNNNRNKNNTSQITQQENQRLVKDLNEAKSKIYDLEFQIIKLNNQLAAAGQNQYNR